MDFLIRKMCILFLIGCLFVTCTGEATLSDSACYGTNPECDFYTLSCNTNQLIQLRNLTVGYKSQSECLTAAHCNSSDTCCTADLTNDVTTLFNLKNTFDAYNNCSGKHECTNVQSPWQLINSNFTSTYVNLEYSCIQESEILNFCGSTVDDSADTNTGTTVQIQFDSRKQNITMATQMDCRCVVAASGNVLSNFSLTLIDVRLHSYETIGNTSQQYNCSTSHITSQVFNSSCVNSTNHHMDNFRYGETIDWTASSVEIYLNDIYSMGVRDAPAMVWLEIAVTDVGSTISVSCNKVFPTTTTSTTSTTPTTTSTTLETSTAPSSTTLPTAATSATTSTSTEQTTLSAGSFTGEENDDDDDFDNVKLYLSIFIPVSCLVILPFLCIGIWKYRQKKRGGKQLKYLKSENGLRSYRDSHILDRFIYDITKMDISADSPAVFDEEKEVKSKINQLFVPDESQTRISTISNSVKPPNYSSNNLSTMMKDSHFSRISQPSGPEIGVVNSNRNAIAQNGRNIHNVNPDPLIGYQSAVQQTGAGVVIRINSNKDSTAEPAKAKPISQQPQVKSPKHVVEQLSNGGVLVRIGSQSDKRNEMNTNQTGNAPAIIVPEANEERLSATAHVLPGLSKGEENSVLFVNKSIRRPT